MSAFLLESNFREFCIALVTCAALFLVAACANASGTMLTENTGVVSALGSATSDRDGVFEVALIEAGNLARAHGYQYFIVLKSEDSSTYAAPSTAARDVRPGFEITVKMYREGEIDSHADGVWNVDSLPGRLRRDR